MTILCTGATGLVGYNFLKSASEAGFKVVALCGKNKLPQMKNVTPVSVDLTDINALQRIVLDVFPEVIVNCAAIASPVDVDANPDLANNYQYTMELTVRTTTAHKSIHFFIFTLFTCSLCKYRNTVKNIKNAIGLYSM